MFITVFTPTYNRAYALPKLFESLRRQTLGNFEWVVVDDGSSDDTEHLLSKLTIDADFPIKYFKQENGGKHIAINKGMELASGNYFLTIDSDDFLADNAIEKCFELSEKIEQQSGFAAFSFIRFSECTPYDEKNYGKKEWTKNHTYKWEFKGEMVFAYKTDAIKKYRFPVFKDEKFCQEAVQILPFMRDYKVLFTDNVLAFGEYLEDGLSSNIYSRLLANPRYAMLSIKEKILSYGTDEQKLQMAKSYWDIAQKSKHISWGEKLTGLPAMWTMKVFLNKFANIIETQKQN